MKDTRIYSYLQVVRYISVMFKLRKDKVFPLTDYGNSDGKKRCSSSRSLTSALDEGEWSKKRPLPVYLRQRELLHILQEAAWAQRCSEGLRKISSPQRFDPLTVQPVANSYTDYAIPAGITSRP